MLHGNAKLSGRRVARKRTHASRRAFSVAAQPTAFEMVGEQRVHPDEAVVATHFKRLFKTRGHPMSDPPLDPAKEIFQLENFWSELQSQVNEWQHACNVLDAVRSGETPTSINESDLDTLLQTVHLKGDKIFHFFTHMRAHLDRNPRERIAFYESRPEGMEDVFGQLLAVLSRQIDTDYCPRCHLRNDGTTTVCGDPTIVNEFHYGANKVMGFEAPEIEHSFWTPAWLTEYEGRAKELWYQALQLPFFRTSTRTAQQCESFMEIYRNTLNRGEANHFMRQCQVHGLPITQRMVDLHQEILQNTNAHTVFFHGDPKAASPRGMRRTMEDEKLSAMEDKDGLVKLPPASYLPHSNAHEMYTALPAGFTVEEDGWVSDFQAVSQQLQESVDDWSPIKSQRAESSEFPDWAYSEKDLAEMDFWRHEIRKNAGTSTQDNIKRRSKLIHNSRVRVHGLGSEVAEGSPAAEGFTFPTATAYDVFDTSDVAFEAFQMWPCSGDSEMLKFAIQPGAFIKATTLAQHATPHLPDLSHRFPIRLEGMKGVPHNKLPVVEFSTVSRSMIEILEFNAKSQASEKIEQWRRSARPWCSAKWEELETSKEYKHIRSGAKIAKEGGGATLTLVGVYDGKLWASKADERCASVVLGSKEEPLSAYKPVAGGVDVWSVQEHIDVEGIVVGMKDELVWVQWGPDAVATPIGSNVEEICQNFRKLQILAGTHTPVEPPSWQIPFRNAWREERLAALLRKPWTDMPFTPNAKRQTPVDKRKLSDPKSYRIDDYKTKEHELRVDTRNLLGGSTRLVGGRRWVDDAVFSVNMEGNGTVHTGHGAPQADVDELAMPIGVEDGSNDAVAAWEIDEMEQCLRDIGGRAAGASQPRVDTIAPDFALADPHEVRRHSRLNMAQRTTPILNSRNPANQEISNLDKGLLATRNQLKKQEHHEFGGLKDIGHMEIMPHEHKLVLGKDSMVAPHQYQHLTGREALYKGKVPSTLRAFTQLNEYYQDICQPFDVGHQEVNTFPKDALLQTNKPSHSMSVGRKRRMAGLLLRLFTKKLESQKGSTLNDFIAEHSLNRLSFLAWFSGDSPATPSVLRAMKEYLYKELKEMDLLDDLKLDNIDTYSPVYEPGFYKWLDKSRFEHQYELLVGAKLHRFEPQNRGLIDGLSVGDEMDVSLSEATREYQDRLMGGNVSHMNKNSLDEYDARTKKLFPRINVSPRTNLAGAHLADVQTNLGYNKEAFKSRLTGQLSMTDMKMAVYSTLVSHRNDTAGNPVHVETNIHDKLKDRTPMDADAALAFAKEWNEGMSMDILYAIRRNRNNAALRERFESFMNLKDQAKQVTEKLDGLYEHSGGAFRITHVPARDTYIVENATLDATPWVGDLTQPSPGEYSAEVSTTEDGVAGVLTVSRVSSDEVEFTFTTAADKDAEEVAHLAQAKRVDIDLEGTMWKLYVEGNWAPGVDEAVAFAFTWTTENQDLVKWDLEQAKLKPADVSFVRSALLSSVVAGSVEYGAPYLDKTGLVKRDFSASGPLAELDKWMVTALPYLEKEMLSAVKIDEDTFSFKCTEVATDVVPVESAAALPFRFESFRSEVARTEQKWWRLGMDGLIDRDAPVLKRRGLPHYGELIELLHWLDVLVSRVDAEVQELNAATPDSGTLIAEHQTSIKNRIAKWREVQDSCVREVLDYQKSRNPDRSPVLLGKAGFNATIDGDLIEETEKLTGFMAKVVDRQLPLLRWWSGTIEGMQRERIAADQALAAGISRMGNSAGRA